MVVHIHTYAHRELMSYITDLIFAGDYQANLSTKESRYTNGSIAGHRKELPAIPHYLLDKIRDYPHTLACTQEEVYSLVCGEILASYNIGILF